jgi:hypothetical protein
MVGNITLPLGAPPSITPFPWEMITWDYSTKTNHQGETRKLTQFFKKVIPYATSTTYPHPHALKIKHNTLHKIRTNIPHGDDGLPSPILWVTWV